jgi:hypothetical protein
LKKIEAAGDMTATEITIAWGSPSTPCRSAGRADEDDALVVVDALVAASLMEVSWRCLWFTCCRRIVVLRVGYIMSARGTVAVPSDAG